MRLLLCRLNQSLGPRRVMISFATLCFAEVTHNVLLTLGVIDDLAW